MELSISLCMIVRDEADCLERCLLSVLPYVREMIIVDTGSVDETREIARRYGARVEEVAWTDDFSAARNAGLALATGDWIFVLDADEQLVSVDVDRLREQMSDGRVYGFYVHMIHSVGDPAEGEFVTDSVCRLFRNDPRIRFSGTVHEEVVSSILRIPGAVLARAPIRIAHDGYLEERIVRKRKNERNARLLETAARLSPGDPRIRYAVGTEYFQRRDYERAWEWFREALRHAPVTEGYTSDLALKAAYCLREIGKMDEASGLIDQALVFYPDFTDLLELKAVILFESNRPAAALDAVKRALRAGDSSERYSSVSGSGTYRTLYWAGRIRESLALWEEAKEDYVRALGFRPGYLPVWKRLAFLLTTTDGFDELARLVRDTTLDGPVREAVDKIICEAALDTANPDVLKEVRPLLVSCRQRLRLDFFLDALNRRFSEAKRKLADLPDDSDGLQEKSLLDWALVRATGARSAAESENAPEKSELSPSLMLARSCALLRMGAWEAFVRFQSDMVETSASLFLPAEGGMRPFFRAPADLKQKLDDVAGTDGVALTATDAWILGLLAWSRNDRFAAVNWFARCVRDSGKPEARRALAHACVSAARLVNRNRGPDERCFETLNPERAVFWF